jgi:hypothetical protein
MVLPPPHFFHNAVCQFRQMTLYRMIRNGIEFDTVRAFDASNSASDGHIAECLVEVIDGAFA